MTVDQAIQVFLSYSSRDKQEFLARLIHELTIVARDYYEVGQGGLTDPKRMRSINEVQHRVSDFLCALLHKNPQRYPDDVLVRIILEHPDDSTLERQLSDAFARLANQHLPVA